MRELNNTQIDLINKVIRMVYEETIELTTGDIIFKNTNNTFLLNYNDIDLRFEKLMDILLPKFK